MFLVSITDLSVKEQSALGPPTVKRDFRAGWEMSVYMQGVIAKCKKLNNGSTVYWHSNHLQVLLWFSDEKYSTMLDLM
jgi:hypothetical protein